MTKPWEPVKQQLYESQFEGNDGRTAEQRLQDLRDMGRRADADFKTKYELVRQWFVEYDALYLLSFCAFYFLTTPEGTDREDSDKRPFAPHFLEIMQAFALTSRRSYKLQPLLWNARRLFDEWQEIGELMLLRLFNIPDRYRTEQELNLYRLRTEMMTKTIGIRNWAFPDQMKRSVVNVLKRVSARFHSTFDVAPDLFSTALFDLVGLIERRFNAHLSTLRPVIEARSHPQAMFEAYYKAFNLEPKSAADFDVFWEMANKDPNKLFALLMAHADLRLPDLFTFSIKDVAHLYGAGASETALGKVLDQLSLRFGELADSTTEFFILDNPVHSRPFIRLSEGRYFVGLLVILPHTILNMMEGLIAEDETLRAEYSQERADFLEEQTEHLFRSAFGSEGILAGGKWTDSTGVNWENDLLLVREPFAIVVECKSGTVTAPARRAAPERLARTLRELIVEPSEQAARLVSYLKGGSPIRLTNSKGQSLTIETSRIKYYLTVAVSYEQFGLLATNPARLRDAGVCTLEPRQLALSMNVNDLECVFELLDAPDEKIHYLARRKEFELTVEYAADELDLLAFYLENGFNIGSDEFSNENAFMLAGKSRELNPYFIGRPIGKPVSKPVPSRTAWWNDMLTRIREKGGTAATEVCYILHSTAPEDQRSLEESSRDLLDQFRAGQLTEEHNWIVGLVGPPERRFLLAFYAAKPMNAQAKATVVETIANHSHAEGTRGVVVIGLDTEGKHYPFSFVARSEGIDLIDLSRTKRSPSERAPAAQPSGPIQGRD